MTKINADVTERVESGALQINDDWNGLFIRGDWCIELMFILQDVLKGEILNPFQKAIFESYEKMIREDVLK